MARRQECCVCREWVGDTGIRTLDVWNGLEELVRVVVLRVGSGWWCACAVVCLMSAFSTYFLIDANEGLPPTQGHTSAGIHRHTRTPQHAARPSRLVAPCVLTMAPRGPKGRSPCAPPANGLSPHEQQQQQQLLYQRQQHHQHRLRRRARGSVAGLVVPALAAPSAAFVVARRGRARRSPRQQHGWKVVVDVRGVVGAGRVRLQVQQQHHGGGRRGVPHPETGKVDEASKQHAVQGTRRGGGRGQGQCGERTAACPSSP